MEGQGPALVRARVVAVRPAVNATRCIYGSAVRPDNATFCPNCGRPFDLTVRPPDWAEQSITMRFVTAVKLGFGFALGGAAFGALISAIVLIAAALLAQRLF